MASIRLDKDLERRLDHLSKTTHRTSAYYLTAAVMAYLEEYEERLLAASLLVEEALL
jgi:predicted DNA-binding protein